MSQHKKAQHRNSRHVGRIGFSKRPAATLCLLASAALFCLSAAGDGAAFERPPQTVDAAARRLGLVAVSSQNLTLSGGTLFHFRIDNGRQVPDVVRDLEAENIGIAQPNYVYRLPRSSGPDAHAAESLFVLGVAIQSGA